MPKTPKGATTTLPDAAHVDTPSAITPAASWRKLRDLIPWAKNPRANDAAVPKVAASIRRFGFPTTLVANADTGELVAGHTRTRALESILALDPSFTLTGSPGPGYVPVREHWFASEADAHAYALADNRLAEEAEWDEVRLREVAAEIIGAGILDEDEGGLAVLGFDHEEVAFLLDEQPDASTPGAPHASPGTNGGAPPPNPGTEFQKFDTDVASTVKKVVCPSCKHEFPV